MTELQKMAAEFNDRTKAAIPGCAFAAMNVTEDDELLCIWGDFKSKKAATQALRTWAVFAKKTGKPDITSRIEGEYIRLILDFETAP
jgi:hypothetical protein